VHKSPMNEPAGLRLGLARLFDSLGLLGLPLGVGVAVGFWVADRGVRWLPHVLEALILLGVACLLMLLLGMRLRRGHLEITPAGVRVRRRVAVVFALLLVASLAWLITDLAEQPSPLTTLPPESLAEAFAQDADRYREHAAGLERLVARLDVDAIFPAQPEDATVLGADEERMLLGAWTTALDYTTALEGTRVFWEDWYRFDPSRVERPWMLRSFLLSFACEVAMVEGAAELARVVRRNPHARKYLDNPHPEVGLEAGSFSRFLQVQESGEAQAYVVAGAQYMRWMDDVMRWRTDVWSEGLGWLWTDVEDRLERMTARGLFDRASITMVGEGQLLKRAFRRAWLPTQQKIAERIGDTKLRRIGWFLITPEQQEELDRNLESGDLLITRKNWYLSNVGLPGWWPHGILYLGAPDKLAAWADDPEVRELVEELTGEPMSFGAYMAERYPLSWLEYQLGQGGEPIRLIEAIKPGVVFNPLTKSSGDSLVALRPRLSKRAKAQAIIEAFAHVGKPYDFDFDFATDHALVCTELIWRAYRPAEGKEGLDLPITDVAGRKTLPAIEIVQMFIEEHGTQERQFDFVYFLDALEEQQISIVSTEQVFLTTPARGKWGADE
jgi:hypothetical protein